MVRVAEEVTQVVVGGSLQGQRYFHANTFVYQVCLYKMFTLKHI